MAANISDINDRRKGESRFGEIGVTGLKRQSGYVYEEYLRELQGERWQRVIKQMVNYPIIGSILFAIDSLVRQVTWDITPASESNADLETAEFVRGALFEDMSYTWPDTVSEILTYLPYGWSWFETVYKLRAGDTDDSTRRSVFSDNRIGWRKFAIRSQDSLDRWEFDESGGTQGMWQNDHYTQKETVLIPVTKSLHFTTVKRKNNPEGISVLRTSYESWYAARNIARIEAIGIERDLAGLPVVYIPSEIIKTNSTEFTAYKNMAVNLRRDEMEGVVLPSDRDENNNLYVELKLLSTGGTRQFDVDKTINRYDHRIAASMLADFIMLGTKAEGSYALSKDKTQLFTVALGTFLDNISAVFNRYAVPRLLKLNGIKYDKPPLLTHGKIEAVDLGALGAYIKSLTESGMILFPTADGQLENRLVGLTGLPAPSPESFAEKAEAMPAKTEPEESEDDEEE